MPDYLTPEDLENAHADAATLGEVVNGDNETTVESRLGEFYPSIANALYTVIQTGGFEPFLTQTALLASVPTLPKKAAKAMDTKKVWLWNGSGWVDTGLSELDQAKADADANPLFKPALVTSGQYSNIDQVTTSGRHVINNNTIAAAITGLPEPVAGVIDVTTAGGLTTQTFKPSNSGVSYTRTSNAAGVFTAAFIKYVGQIYIDAAIATGTQKTRDDLTVEGSKNIFDAAKVRDGYRLGSGGNVAAVAGAKCSDYMPIEGGATYTISAASKPTGVAFYTERNGTGMGYSAAALNPQTVIAPPDAKFMVVNVKREADPSDAVNLQVEKGAVATAYAPYSARPVLRESTIPNNVITTANVKTASAKAYDIINLSKNLFKESDVVMNSYITNTGLTSGSTGWARSGAMAVTAGQVLTLSGTRGRAGLVFVKSTVDLVDPTNVVQYVSDTTMPLTVTVPALANFVLFNLQSSTVTGWANIQLEIGATPTQYIPNGQTLFQVDGNAIVNLPSPVMPLSLALGTFTGGVTQKIKGVQGTDTVEHTVQIAAAPSHAGSRVFNWVSTALSGVTLHTCGDDAAPYRINDTTLGANHGYSRTILTMTAHGKTFIDVGSVWTTGGKEWVIVSIDSVNTLAVTARTDNTAIAASSGTLTHVSGATNTAAINWTAVLTTQWYPMLKNHKVSVTADGKPIDPTSTTPINFNHLSVNQSYELMTKPAIVEWLIARTKTNVDLTEYAAASNVSVSMNYVFDKYGNCTFSTDFLALDAVLLSNGTTPIMFQQTARLTPAVDGNVLYYMPNALSITHEGTVYDFANKANVSTFAPSTRLNMTLDRVAVGKDLNRVVQLTNNWGYASGFLPILVASPTNRRTLSANKFLQLNNNEAKIYFSALDNGTLTLNAGDYYSAICYRNYFKRPIERTDNYAVQSRQGDFYYIDWHIATTDRVSLPAEYQGRAFSVHDKSSTVTVLGLNESGIGSATNSVTCKTTGSGYAILKFI